jgi:cbb3-type cytochrome oxidase maturation protein
MTMIFLLSAISLILAIGFLSAFIWAVKSGQFEDDYTPSVRILFDDSTKKDKSKSNNKIENKNQKQ